MTKEKNDYAVVDFNSKEVAEEMTKKEAEELIASLINDDEVDEFDIAVIHNGQIVYFDTESKNVTVSLDC